MAETISAREAAEVMEEIVDLQEANSATEKRIKELKKKLRAFMDENGIKEWGDGEHGIVAKIEERNTSNGHKYDLDKVDADTVLRAWQAYVLQVDHGAFKAIKRGNDSGWMDALNEVYSEPGKTEYFTVKRG